MSSKTEILKNGIGDATQDETRRQLLEAAGEVFAEVGFKNATVREICGRANANIAAVNYHFGDKEKLYREVLRYCSAKAVQKHPPLLNVKPDAPPEKRLHAFIHSFLLRIFDKSPTSWHGKLMLREMVEPTAALDLIIEERIRPMSTLLWKIVAEILHLPVDDKRVRLYSFSVVSQCVFYHHCRPMMIRLFPDQMVLDADGIEELAEHISRFSLAAMKGPANGKL